MEAPIVDLKHKVHFVAETSPADKLLKLFQTSRQHIAVVVDDYAAIRGVITLEDVDSPIL